MKGPMSSAEIIGKVGGLTILASVEKAKTEKGHDRIWISVRQKTKDPAFAITASLNYRHSCDICFQKKEEK